jgi:flagellin
MTLPIELVDELDRIATSTKFNGKAVIDGSLSGTGATFQVGANAGGDQVITFNIASAKSADLGTGVEKTDLLVTTNTTAQASITAIDAALKEVDEIRGGLGAVQNRFESTIANLNNSAENISAARSRILDADIAQETSAMTKSNILQQAGVAILAQANQAPQLALSLLQ